MSCGTDEGTGRVCVACGDGIRGQLVGGARLARESWKEGGAHTGTDGEVPHGAGCTGDTVAVGAVEARQAAPVAPGRVFGVLRAVRKRVVAGEAFGEGVALISVEAGVGGEGAGIEGTD